MKASDVTDAELLAAIRRVIDRYRPARYTADVWDIQAELQQYPPEVVRSKLQSAVDRHVINGCLCGCRGDFDLLGTADGVKIDAGLIDEPPPRTASRAARGRSRRRPSSG